MKPSINIVMSMMKSYILPIIAAVAMLTYSCTPGEDPIVPSNNYSVIRFEFPQGNNSWDMDLKEIHDTYGVYLLYKDINDKDLNKTWTAIPTGNLFYGNPLNDSQVQYYVNFFKNNFFNYLTPSFTKNSMPVKIYMLDNLRSVPRDAEDDGYNGPNGYSQYFINTKFDGFDYWAISFKNSEMTDDNVMDSDGVTPLLKIKRCAFLYKLLVNALKNEDIVEPTSFGEGTDYQTAYRTTDSAASNYYMKRGFIDVLTADFQLNRNGMREAPSLYVSYWRSTQQIEPEVGAHRDFMVYVRAAMFYTQAEFFAKYDAEEYPLIAEKYGIVTDYFRNKVGIDLEQVAIGK